jgi:hypothetical protein
VAIKDRRKLKAEMLFCEAKGEWEKETRKLRPEPPEAEKTGIREIKNTQTKGVNTQ